MVKENTKQKILEVGADIIHLKGFNHTGIQEVLQAAEIPKGSFYNYFKSKEDFGLQVIDYFIDFFSSMVEPIIKDPSFTSLGKIRRMLDQFIEVFSGRDFAYGCPIGNLAQEMGDLSPAFRDKLKEAFDFMANIYMKLVREGQSNGEISEKVHVENAAYFIVTSWHGALGHMKIEKSTKPLESHKHYIFNHILEPG